MSDKKIINIIYVSFILPIILLISIFLFFFFSVNKVYAMQTYGPNTIAYGLDTSGTSTQIANYTWVTMPVDNNYINVGFGGYNGAFQSHILIEMEFLDSQVGNGYKRVSVNAFINGIPQSGVSGNCPNSGNKANCDVYFNGVLDSNSSNLVLQLKLTGTYWTFYTTRIRVSGSITIDETTSSLNNASFNQGVNSINSNISGSTQSITQNNINNTQSIINNQNANSQAQIDAIEKQNLKCENIRIDKNNATKTTNGVLTYQGIINPNAYNMVSDYIPINKGKIYNIQQVGFMSSTNSFCLYNENKEQITCSAYNSQSSINITPTVEGYIRYTINKSTNNNTILTGEYCYNMLDKQNQTSENIENALNDSSVDNPSSALDGLNVNIGTNSVISDLLLLPVSLYQSVLNNINGTCSAFTLGTMFNHTLRMPCLNISGVIGSTIYGVIDVLISGFFILSIRKKFVDIFNHFTSLKVGGNELE